MYYTDASPTTMTRDYVHIQPYSSFYTMNHPRPFTDLEIKNEFWQLTEDMAVPSRVVEFMSGGVSKVKSPLCETKLIQGVVVSIVAKGISGPYICCEKAIQISSMPVLYVAVPGSVPTLKWDYMYLPIHYQC
jgi:hypothetical protein